MTPLSLRNLFRSEMVDEETPYLWSDADLDVYIDDANTWYYRLTGGRADATTTAVTDLVIVADDEWVDTHEAILKIKGAHRTDTGASIEILNYEDLPSRGIRLDDSVGEVARLIIGMEPNKARIHPISNESVTVRLTTMRLPLVNPVTAGVFEIDSQHHMHLLHWVKRCAYLKQDSQTFNRSKSEEFETKFRAYCESARIERDRALHKPRAVVYGGI